MDKKKKHLKKSEPPYITLTVIFMVIFLVIFYAMGIEIFYRRLMVPLGEILGIQLIVYYNYAKEYEKKLNLNTYLEELGCTVGEELLRVHRCYFQKIASLLQRTNISIHGIAHITGGGFIDNIGRLLKDGLCAEITNPWEIPPVFRLIQQIENVSDKEMRRVFNLGIGMILIVASDNLETVQRILNHQGKPISPLIGEIKKTRSQKKKVVFTY